MSIDLYNKVSNELYDKIKKLEIRDGALRNKLEKSFYGEKKVFLPNVSITLNNNITQFMKECNKVNIVFPSNIRITYDLLVYLEHLYYFTLNDGLNNFNQSVKDLVDMGLIKKVFKRNEYIKKAKRARSTLIDDYINLNTMINDFDMDYDGQRVLNYIIDDNNISIAEMTKIVGYHKAYHSKRGNEEILEYIDNVEKTIK